MAGLPPLFGFIGKELLYEATLKAPLAAPILTGATLLTNACMVVVAGMVAFTPFFGSAAQALKDAHEAPPAMWTGPMALALFGLLIGILPNLIAGSVISPAVGSILAQPAPTKLVLLHGLTAQLVLSGITFVVGIAAYFRRDALGRMLSRIDMGPFLGPERWYRWALDFMNFAARLQTRILQNGHLHFYLLTIVLTTAGLVGWSLVNQRTTIDFTGWSDIRSYEWLIGFIILGAIAMTVRARSRFLAIVGVGVIGYSVALIFIIYGAPDLAMTQFSIDTLTVVLLVLVLYRMPRYVTYSKFPERLRDGVAACVIAVTVTALLLMATATAADSRLADYFTHNAYTLAQGHNIVNVILVDFRALDTMGEITVLAVAAIGVYSLLKSRTGGDQ
jgi:multicomponent Na+:H+ antiporter subunit A